MPSRSGLYASDLPGVEIAMLEGLTKTEQADYEAFHESMLKRAWLNLVSDVSNALQNKFFVDSKIIARETSEFRGDVNTNNGLAGVYIEFDLPKYARIHIVSVEVFSEADYLSPDAQIKVLEKDANGQELLTVTEDIYEGRNIIYIDEDFDEDKLFVAFDPQAYQFRKTENRHYNSYYNHWDKLECTFPCFGQHGYQGTVKQVNGGGVNVKYNVVCSAEKFVCENINLFKKAFFYRYGVEIMDEALLGNRLNRFTTMTEERANDRSEYFGGKYTSNLEEAIKSHNIVEDPLCFRCKNVVMSTTIIP
jgi:hypothetical protein